MAYFIVVDAGTGKILRTGSAPLAAIEQQAQIGEFAIEAPDYIRSASHYWTATGFKEFPAQPSPYHTFDFASEEWSDFRSEAQIASDLLAAKDRAMGAVNRSIAQIRTRYVTNMPAQDMIYLRKEQEARSWVSSASPDLSDYPMIASEIGITGADADQVAQVWLNMSSIWVTVAASLEQIRLGTSEDIYNATSDAGIDATVSAFLETVATL